MRPSSPGHDADRTNRDTGFDIRLLAKINDALEKEVMPKYKHLLDDTKMSIIDINVLLHQTPAACCRTW